MHTILTSQGNRIKVTDSQFDRIIKASQSEDSYYTIWSGAGQQLYSIPLNQFRK